MLAFFGPLPTMSAGKVNKLFGELEEGFRTLPINRPGYQYYEALQVCGGTKSALPNLSSVSLIVEF